MRRRRNAKIVATLGPSTTTPERIAALFDIGVDVFRLNFSHGLHEEHAARLAAIRTHETATGRPIGVMADLQGPKLRIATFAEGKLVQWALTRPEPPQESAGEEEGDNAALPPA